MENNLEFRDKTYFNENDTYLYDNGLGTLVESKATFENGFYWLSNRYKATTVKCVKI